MRWGLVALCVVACSGRQTPTAPAPEYERPEVMPWDAAAPVDPLDNLKGEEVTDDPEPPEAGPAWEDAGAEAARDAAVEAG